jgi:hypothetical protein
VEIAPTDRTTSKTIQTVMFFMNGHCIQKTKPEKAELARKGGFFEQS